MVVAAIEAATAVEIGTEIVEGVIVIAATVIVTTAAQMQDLETSATLTVFPSSFSSRLGSKGHFNAKFSLRM